MWQHLKVGGMSEIFNVYVSINLSYRVRLVLQLARRLEWTHLAISANVNVNVNVISRTALIRNRVSRRVCT